MNSILPANVRPYFFFNGEKMDDLTRADNRDVQNAVRNVMQLPALERAEEHLSKVAAEYRREIKKQGSPELERLISREEDLRSQKERLIQRNEELKEEVRLARQHVFDLEALLRDKEVARALQEQRDMIQETLEELERQERDRVHAIQRTVNEAHISLLQESARKALVVLDRKRERGEIPSGIREQFLRDLLESMECVCGRALQHGDEGYNKLEALLRRTTSTQLESEVIKLAGNIRVISGRTSHLQESLTDLARDHAGIKQRKEKHHRELDDVKRQLIGASEEEVAGLEKQRARFQRDLEMAIAEQGSNESSLRNIERQLEDVVKQKRDAEAKEQKLIQLARRENLAQQASDAVSKIKGEFFEMTRQEIEAATREVFSKLAWKQDHFQDIRLDQDFRLEVIDRWGMPTRKELSAGERQILSLAFICAMAKVSGQAAPLIMDTPFGRLSGNHLAAVAENLPKLTSQLVLFVTDREWDEASRTSLEPCSGAQYELKFDCGTGCTDIVEVPWL